MEMAMKPYFDNNEMKRLTHFSFVPIGITPFLYFLISCTSCKQALPSPGKADEVPKLMCDQITVLANDAMEFREQNGQWPSDVDQLLKFINTSGKQPTFLLVMRVDLSVGRDGDLTISIHPLADQKIAGFSSDFVILSPSSLKEHAYLEIMGQPSTQPIQWEMSDAKVEIIGQPRLSSTTWTPTTAATSRP
jgi:hypothetical protein